MHIAIIDINDQCFAEHENLTYDNLDNFYYTYVKRNTGQANAATIYNIILNNLGRKTNSIVLKATQFGVSIVAIDETPSTEREPAKKNHAIIRQSSNSGHSPSMRYKSEQAAINAARHIAEKDPNEVYEVVRIVKRVYCRPKVMVEDVR